jgi:hypothetical protein
LSKESEKDALNLSGILGDCEKNCRWGSDERFFIDTDLWDRIKEDDRKGWSDMLQGHAFHNAAYDAFACGKVFAIVAHSKAPRSHDNAVQLAEYYMPDYLNRCYVRGEMYNNPGTRDSFDFN